MADLSVIKPFNKKSGNLLKWTNYWNGWQPRWFVLDDGMLTYYWSSDTVDEGIKGSLRVADAQISVHPTDPNRMDIVMPGDQQLQLKANSPHDRQEWLIALGTIKTSLNTQNTSKFNGYTMRFCGAQTCVFCELTRQRKKEQELRTYCDIMADQVEAIKAAVVEENIDVERLDSSKRHLNETCDKFLLTLRDCMSLSDYRQPSPPPMSSAQYSPPASVTSSNKSSQSSPNGQARRLDNRNGRVESADNTIDGTEFYEAPDTPEPDDTSSINGMSAMTNGNTVDVDNDNRKKPTTMFSTHPISFMTIRLADDGAVDTIQFLAACTSLTAIFDILGGTAFAPVKMDLNGNIRKLRNKYDTNPDRFQYIQPMIQSEVDKGSTMAGGSATDALLWLKRGVCFVREFLVELDTGAQMGESANRAYTRTLRPHHNFVVRGVFSVGARARIATSAAPDRQSFINALYHPCKLSEFDPALVKQCIHTELVCYVAGIDRCMKQINKFYKQHRLDPDLIDA